MPFTGDPVNVPTDRIRLIVGDTEDFEEALTDAVYQWILDNAENESVAAIRALRLIVARYASYVTEKAGGLFVKESDKYRQYRDLLELFTTNPLMALARAGQPYAGGVSNDEICDNLEDEDQAGVKYDWRVNGISGSGFFINRLNVEDGFS